MVKGKGVKDFGASRLRGLGFWGFQVWGGFRDLGYGGA